MIFDLNCFDLISGASGRGGCRFVLFDICLHLAGTLTYDLTVESYLAILKIHESGYVLFFGMDPSVERVKQDDRRHGSSFGITLGRSACKLDPGNLLGNDDALGNFRSVLVANECIFACEFSYFFFFLHLVFCVAVDQVEHDLAENRIKL